MAAYITGYTHGEMDIAKLAPDMHDMPQLALGFGPDEMERDGHVGENDDRNEGLASIGMIRGKPVAGRCSKGSDPVEIEDLVRHPTSLAKLKREPAAAT